MAVSLFFGITQRISRLRTRPEGMKTNEVCGRPLETFGVRLTNSIYENTPSASG